ncbi:10865_t:CDS:2 [Acaulospora colombiana]|uniref:10865_t:CDS:1 n=1 Tax=Acaulospora colombiana TaxID=27376 RepID=A0ACA9KK35_9GLOM|nr:10865_t:CDS:2 [Acaulospora colombiana]
MLFQNEKSSLIFLFSKSLSLAAYLATFYILIRVACETYKPYVPSLLNPHRPEFARYVIDYYPSKRHKTCISTISTQQRKTARGGKSIHFKILQRVSKKKRNLQKENTNDSKVNREDNEKPLDLQKPSVPINPIPNKLVQQSRTLNLDLTPEQVLCDARDRLSWSMKSKVAFKKYNVNSTKNVDMIELDDG